MVIYYQIVMSYTILTIHFFSDEKEGKRMEKKEKSTKKQALSDRLAEMPKETKGQRIKYLLEKHGMTQRELAKKLYEDSKDKDKEKDFEAFYSNLNMKISDTAKRNLTYKDVQKIAKILNAYPDYIMQGGHENVADEWAYTFNEMHEEGHLLNTAFSSLSLLAGYTIKKVGLHDVNLFDTSKSIRSQLDEYIIIEHDGKEVSLTIEQFNNLENIIFDHAEITIKRFLEACGKEVR